MERDEVGGLHGARQTIHGWDLDVERNTVQRLGQLLPNTSSSLPPLCNNDQVACVLENNEHTTFGLC